MKMKSLSTSALRVQCIIVKHIFAIIPSSSSRCDACQALKKTGSLLLLSAQPSPALDDLIPISLATTLEQHSMS